MWPLNCSKNRKQSFYFTSAICLYHRTLTLKTQLEGKSDNGSVCELPSSVSYFHRLVVTNGAGACCRAVLIYKAINTTLATKKKRYAMSLSLSDECYYLGICLGGLFFGTISVLQLPWWCLLLKQFQGIYSGIFVLYLQCHASKTDTAKANYFLFSSICFLYILSIATIAFDIVSYVVTTPVSDDSASVFPFSFFLRKTS